MPKIISSAVALLALVTLSACGRPFEAATPEGFVDLGDDRYNQDSHEYRASTADGVVLGARAWENDPKVDLTVAVRALENRVRMGQGYALLDKKEVTARDGTKGIEMRFGHDEPSGSHLYCLTVFVTDDWVYLVEAGGKKDLVEKAAPSIDWSIKNFLPD
ncbi:MAG TPA: serine/threonine protein kinase [Polyangiaceae bacterium]|nr:serine/threonine protein kinase [Polyangiaceae bacterium]